jgi:hypothetical protein
MSAHKRRAVLYLVAVLLAAGVLRPAAAAELQPGEYACAGSGGRLLIGLGFRLNGDGSYTDLGGRNTGTVSYNGSNIMFAGGHLAGQVGRNVRAGTNFEISGISCSLRR